MYINEREELFFTCMILFIFKKYNERHTLGTPKNFGRYLTNVHFENWCQKEQEQKIESIKSKEKAKNKTKDYLKMKISLI